VYKIAIICLEKPEEVIDLHEKMKEDE